MSSVEQILKYHIHKFSLDITNLKTRQTSYINPSSDDWGTYVARKREMSLYLTALNILRELSIYPDIDQFREYIRLGKLSHHSPRNKSKLLANRALKLIRKINNRLDKTPERYRCVEAWVIARKAEYEARKAATVMS